MSIAIMALPRGATETYQYSSAAGAKVRAGYADLNPGSPLEGIT
jgi:hypothetical protein